MAVAGLPRPASPSIAAFGEFHRLLASGAAPDEAGHALGLDPLIVQLWTRLPPDLHAAAAAAKQALPRATPADAPSVPPSVPLNVPVLCAIPAEPWAALALPQAAVVERHALLRTHLLAGLALPWPAAAATAGIWPGLHARGWRSRWVVLSRAQALAVRELAGAHFGGASGQRFAAGWLVLRGAGWDVPLPAAEELSRLAPAASSALAPADAGDRPAGGDGEYRPWTFRRLAHAGGAPRARRAATSPADESGVPDGAALRAQREAAGWSQRDLAAAAQLSRGLVAEVERGHRRNVETRRLLARTMPPLVLEPMATSAQKE